MPQDNEEAHLEDGNANADPQSADALDNALREAGFSPDGSTLNPDEIQAAKSKETPTDKPEDKPEDKSTDKTEGTPSPTDEEKAAAEKKAAEEKAAAEAAAKKDDLDAVELPPYAKPATTQSFEKVKQLAREKIAAAAKERDELRAKLEEVEKTAKDGLPAEAKKELEELREFRAKVDVEADPKFKEFDATIVSNTEAIYSKLAANGFSPDAIKKIKEMGGPDKVDWDGLANRIPSTLKRYVESKLVENEDLIEKRKQAVEKAKENAAEYLKSREGELSRSDSEHATRSTEEWNKEIKPKISWMVIQNIPKDAKPEDRKAAEAHNKLVTDIEADLKDAFEDPSPKMKAILASGYAVSKKLRFEYDLLKATSEAKVASLEKDLKDAKDMIERIKKSSTGRLASSAPVTPGSTKSGKVNLNEHSADALDRLLAETQAAAAEKL